jgi:hypothetical protein
MILQLAVTNDSAQQVSLDLNGNFCTIVLERFYYGKGWFLSVIKNGLYLIAGRRIDSGVPILGTNTADGFSGNFIAYPVTLIEQELGDEPWGITHVLLWYENGINLDI